MLLEPRVRMGTAAYDDDWAGAGLAYLYRYRFLAGRVTPGTVIGNTGVSHAADRNVNDAANGLVVADQCYVDGEFAVSVDEFPGSVQWVYQPVLTPAGTGLEIDIGRLFRQEWNVRRQLGKCVADDDVTGQVGLGQR